MIINHNLNAMNAHRNMSLNNIAQGKSSEKLSSGYRINRAADDAAGLSISEKMRTQIRGLNQAAANAQDGVSLVQTAEGAMNEVSDMLTRMKELAVKASNGTYNTSDLKAMDEEFQALGNAIDDIANKTTFNGITMLNKNVPQSINIQIGNNSGDSVSVTSQNITKTGLGLSGGVSTSAAAKTSLGTIDKAIGLVNKARSEFGAVQNRLEHVYNNLSTTSENLQAAESRIRDTDMAKEMMNYTKLNILQQASNSMLAQANQAPQGVLQLLR
ncbi:flagellin N-terminal helical domain-containing protein [Paenibacillus oleatilyticus]|uniref:Flagellin n=1 Tax=Paenibacillus oleatilyticus TaxID=2594886 RepID=A0ABV4V9T8_9BACL